MTMMMLVMNITTVVVINTKHFTFDMPLQLSDLECRFNWVTPDRLSTRASRVLCSAH